MTAIKESLARGVEFLSNFKYISVEMGGVDLFLMPLALNMLH